MGRLPLNNLMTVLSMEHDEHWDLLACTRMVFEQPFGRASWLVDAIFT